MLMYPPTSKPELKHKYKINRTRLNLIHDIVGITISLREISIEAI